MDLNVGNVSKSFKEIPVVFNLSFEVKAGQILGLLGPNGAGKTTTLRMILDILQPDDGEITFGSSTINRNIRNSIGYLPEERGIYQKYRVADVLTYFGRLKGLSRKKSYVETVRILDRFQLIQYLEEPVFHLSKGMQQKLQFLMAIMHNPEIVILDEPFWGLDPINQDLVRKHILSMKNENKVVIISTHQLSEAESLCDQFVLMESGRLVLQGSLDKIRRKFQHNIIMVEALDNLALLREIRDVQKVEINKSSAHLYVSDDVPVNRLLREIINTVNVRRLEVRKPSLHDIFMQTIQKK